MGQVFLRATNEPGLFFILSMIPLDRSAHKKMRIGVMPGYCKENELVRQVSEGDLVFPNLDSCIGVICHLSDGDRWAIHCVQDSGSGKMLKKLKIATLQKNISSVTVLGNLDIWGYELESQAKLVKKYNIQEANDYAAFLRVRAYFIPLNVAKTRLFIKNYFENRFEKVRLAKCSGDVTEGGGEIASSKNDVVML